MKPAEVKGIIWPSWATGVFAVVFSTLFIYVLIFPLDFLVIESTQRNALLGASLAVVSTLGGLVGLIYFLTAQIRPSGMKSSAVGVIYRDAIFKVVLVSIMAALFSGILGLTGAFPDEVTNRLTGANLTASFAVISSLLPVAIIQFENLNTGVLADKLLRSFSADSVGKYGLVAVHIQEFGNAVIEVKTNGLNYERFDPLRPFHELIEQAIADRDRLLLGRLLGSLCSRVAHIMGARWPGEGSATSDWASVRTGRRELSEGDYQVAVHAVHYIVRLAKNLLQSWPGLDVGRHGAQYQLIKLCAALAKVPNSQPMVRVCLSGVLRISEAYALVRPYGRVEPLNALHRPIRLLSEVNRLGDVEYALRVIAFIAERTAQLDNGRGEPLRNLLTAGENKILLKYRRLANDRSWNPTDCAFDPWGALN